MKIVESDTVNLKNASLILGFFDGIHLGHRAVISNAVSKARENNTKTLLLTFNTAPAEYFTGDFEYIYPRNISYELISKLGVDYLIETDFSKLASIKARDYLQSLIDLYKPIAITTGFNHTFGLGKEGSPNFLEKCQEEYDYEYYCVPPVNTDNNTVSSSLIRELLKDGQIESANNKLAEPFALESTIIHGARLGRQIGFPTANMLYPEKIVKIPYGVYLVRVFDMLAVLNWGIKPSFGMNKEIMEVHIPNFDGNLYGKTLRIQILRKIRDEKRFENIEDLKTQIAKDVQECLKL